MKNIYIKILILFLTVFSFSSCEDFLEEDAKGLLTPSNFFKNEEEANLALNGLVARMRNNNVCGQTMIRQQTMGTDVCVSGRFALAGAWQFSLYNLDTDNGNVFGIWSSLYAGIRDANLIIASVEASSLSEEVKENTIAQAKFYRAYFYYRLTTMWGDVPYWRDEVNIDEVSILGKSTVAEIQAGMIADLSDAINSGYMSTDT